MANIGIRDIQTGHEVASVFGIWAGSVWGHILSVVSSAYDCDPADISLVEADDPDGEMIHDRIAIEGVPVAEVFYINVPPLAELVAARPHISLPMHEAA